jgi:hypothetical protein
VVAAEGSSLNRLALSATAHCLTGCAIGEVLGMVIGTALEWGNIATIALAVVLAFFFGYSLTMIPLLRSGLALARVLPLAFAADTLSITVMEIVDNLIMVVIPGAMEAGLGSLLFWGSLAFALAVAFVAAFPVNRWLISRGRGACGRPRALRRARRPLDADPATNVGPRPEVVPGPLPYT